MTLNKWMRLLGVNKNIIKLQGSLNRMSKSYNQTARKRSAPVAGITYLLPDGLNYKIGMTTRWVDERVKELNSSTSVYREIYVVAYSVNDDCYGLEKALHKRYASERINSGREWFNLSDMQVQEIKDIFLEESEGIPPSETNSASIIIKILGVIFIAWVVKKFFELL
jgi:hypothetical protein